MNREQSPTELPGCFTAFSMALCLMVLTTSLPTNNQAAEPEPAGSPARRSFDDHIAYALAHPSAADAELHILEAYALVDHVVPQHILKALRSIGEAPRSHSTAALRQRARYLESALLLRMGQFEEASAVTASLGFLDGFTVAGPFENEGGLGFDKSTPADDAIVQSIDTSSRMEGRMGRPVQWRAISPEAAPHGYVHLETAVYPRTGICAYAATDVLAKNAGTGMLRMGAHGAFKAWWNGALAIEDERYREPDFDRHFASVRLRAGPNRLVVKVCNKETPALGFMARLTDTNGRPLPTSISDSVTDAVADAHTRRWKRVESKLGQLLKAARRPRASASDRHRAALWMHLTGAKDPDRHDARDFARGACDALENASHCLLWAQLVDDRNERLSAIHAALTVEPASFEARLALAHMELSGFNHTRARAHIGELRNEAPDDPRVLLAYAELLARDGFEQTALFELEKAINRADPPPSLLHAASYLSQQLGLPEQVFQFNRRALSSSFTVREVHRILAVDALARNDHAGFTGHVRSLTRLAPFEDETWAAVAALYESAGRHKEATQSHLTRLRLCPDNPDAVEAWGFYLLRQGRHDDGYAQLARVLELRPQSAKVRRYFDHVQSGTSLEHQYAIAPGEFLALGRSVQAHGSGLTYLVDQTVTRVHLSGLATRFVQTATMIHTEEAARSMRYQYISLVPKAEELRVLSARVFKPSGAIQEIVGRGTVPTSEPWYRLYYDVNAEVLELPPLAPGDIVELSYRLSDIAPLNAFYDYFGELQLIEDEAPKRFWRYVAIVPASIQLAVGPIDAPVQREIVEDGENRIYTFEARELPAVDREANMGGTTSGLGYLHLSTYSSWDSLGRWYRGLINGQLLPGEAVKAKARDLVRGLRSPREKVNRLYRHVIESTRYVGLEFGIYGYKPYKVSQVFSRGFGDCKDKAALLVAMLKVVGIEAEIALVRTRHIGDIHQTPASLAAFNHAIVYVPSLDLWLDGTAEYHGTDELPFEDQGVLALRIGSEATTVTRTPTMPPEFDTTRELVIVRLQRDGDASVEGTLLSKGPSAAHLRRELEVEQTRLERFGHILSATLPHARLQSTRFEDISNPNAPVSIRYQARVPHLGHTSNGRLAMPTGLELSLTERYARSPGRKHPLVLGPRQHLEKSVTITVPPGYTITSSPQSTNISSRFGWLTLDVRRTARGVELARTFEMTTHEIPPEDYGAFSQFCRQVDSALAGKIRLSPRGGAQ